MTATNDTLLELLSEFVHLRQTGTSREAAWQKVLRHASEVPLGTAEVIELLSLAKNWEKREGHKHYLDERESTENERPETRLLQPPSTLPLVDELDTTARIFSTDIHESTTYFDDHTELILQFEAMGIPFKLFVPQNQEVLIGRSVSNGATPPGVDLSIAGEVSSGISRTHAALRQRNCTLVITDMGSRNFTYVNNVRLYPHEVRVLQHGDKIRLANLVAQVYFLRKR